MRKDQYSSDAIRDKTQVELVSLQSQFKRDHMQWWKFGVLVGYNLMALYGLYMYVNSNRKIFKSKVSKPKIDPIKLTLFNIAKKGTIHATLLFSAYLAGLYLIRPFTISFEDMHTLAEVQTAMNSFAIRFDPFYQESMLLNHLRKVGVSDSLISSIKDDLKEQKQRLLKDGAFTQKTLEHLQKSEKWYAENKQNTQVFSQVL